MLISAVLLIASASPAAAVSVYLLNRAGGYVAYDTDTESYSSFSDLGFNGGLGIDVDESGRVYGRSGGFVIHDPTTGSTEPIGLFPSSGDIAYSEGVVYTPNPHGGFSSYELSTGTTAVVSSLGFNTLYGIAVDGEFVYGIGGGGFKSYDLATGTLTSYGVTNVGFMAGIAALNGKVYIQGNFGGFIEYDIATGNSVEFAGLGFSTAGGIDVFAGKVYAHGGSGFLAYDLATGQLENFGVASSNGGIAVPEPSALVLAAVGLIALRSRGILQAASTRR